MKCCAGRVQAGSSRLIMIGTFAGIALLFATVIFNFYYSSRITIGNMIVRDVQAVARAIERIHQDCTILSIDYKKNIIDFLNVTTFSGSEVGPLNLLHPDRWRGPYMQDNPTIEGREYILIKTKSGYYVIPADGVRLPNGSVMGKDVVVDTSTDMRAFMRDHDELIFKDKPLVARIDITFQLTAGQVIPDLSDF